jgi:hypothetical protein
VYCRPVKFGGSETCACAACTADLAVGVKGRGDTGVCEAVCNGLTGRAAVLLLANGIIRTVK